MSKPSEFVTFKVRLRPTLKSRIKVHAEKRDLSMNQFVIAAVCHMIVEHPLPGKQTAKRTPKEKTKP